MRRQLREETGLLSLEASIVVTLFIFVMLYLYSFFVVFEVRNEIGHTLLSTANSMALDGYENTMLCDMDTVEGVYNSFYGQIVSGNNDFSDYTEWYNSTTVQTGNGKTKISPLFESAIRNRFIAYLTGGERSKAGTILKRYHIVGGVNGLDFKDSYVADGKLYLSVKYKVEYEFQVFNMKELAFQQSVCSKIWK